MKQQPTITYIKNGIEKNITLNIWNYQKIKKDIFKDYQKNQYISIKEDIELIHFKNLFFTGDVIACENSDTICILENCTFGKKEKQNSLCFQDGSFQVINPELLGISQLNCYRVDDFALNVSNKSLGTDLELLLELKANTITLEGELFLCNMILEAEKITIGSDNNKTKINLLDCGWHNLQLFANEISLHNCLIENKNARKPFVISTKNLKLDATSIIKTNFSLFVNGIPYGRLDNNCRIITQKDLIMTSVISVLKTYEHLLIAKIKTLAKEYATNSLSNENNEIEQKKAEAKELEAQLEKIENELKNLTESTEKQTNKKEKQIVKSLCKKRTIYFNK